LEKAACPSSCESPLKFPSAQPSCYLIENYESNCKQRTNNPPTSKMFFAQVPKARTLTAPIFLFIKKGDDKNFDAPLKYFIAFCLFV
jgi:hypothetical protein